MATATTLNKDKNERLRLKIEDLKRRAAPITYRALAVDEFGELVNVDDSLDKRIVKGYLVVWGQRNLFGEKFIKGCFAKSIKEHGPGSKSAYQIKFLNQHKQSEPCALFEVLEEDDYGLYFETKPLDDVSWANDLIVQLRSKTINNFSLGFDYLWDAIEWDDTDDSLIIKECVLFEGSAVTIPADMGTVRIRSIEDIDQIHEDINLFIKSLPRHLRMQARSIFAKQQSLIDFEPIEQFIEKRKKSQKVNKPVDKRKKRKGIDINYLTKNI